MHKSFDYLYQLVAQDSLEINNIGNTCIHMFNDLGYEWYMIIETDLGECSIKAFGPLHVDKENYFNMGFKFECFHFDYKESIICNRIDKFLNDPKKSITQAVVCDREEAYSKLQKINFEEMR